MNVERKRKEKITRIRERVKEPDILMFGIWRWQPCYPDAYAAFKVKISSLPSHSLQSLQPMM